MAQRKEERILKPPAKEYVSWYQGFSKILLGRERKFSLSKRKITAKFSLHLKKHFLQDFRR